MAAPTILLVDDDPSLTEVIAEYLCQHGLSVDTCGDGAAAVARIEASPPDVVVLDLTMPGMDGLAVCRAVRGAYSGRILMLTALIDDIDEVAGLELGADDYVRKPVQPRVLLARIRALLRRAPVPESGVLRIGSLSIDAGSREARVGARALPLSGGEFQLLHLLASRAGEVVTRDELYQELRGIVWDGLDRSMDLRVSRVRTHLVEAGGTAAWIKSIRAQGYLLVARPA
jgi:DNA-binding response OmpR family regulator